MTCGTLGYEFNLPADRRDELLEAFFLRYHFCLSLENQPSDATLALTAKVRARRTAEFIHLSKVSGAVAGQISAIEPIRPNKDPRILIDTNVTQVATRSSDFSNPPTRKLRPRRTHPNGDVRASVLEGPGSVALAFDRSGTLAYIHGGSLSTCQ